MTTTDDTQVDAILQKLRTLYVDDDHPVHKRVAAFFWGAHDEDVAGYLGLCKIAAVEPMAETLYFWSCGGDMCGGSERSRQVSDWACGVAADFAAQPVRGGKRIESYRPHWARMAAHDGVCLAMYGDQIRDLVPGVNKRAAQLKVRDMAYLTLRNHVQQTAERLIADFRADMERVSEGKFSPDFRLRYEASTGHKFPKD